VETYEKGLCGVSMLNDLHQGKKDRSMSLKRACRDLPKNVGRGRGLDLEEKK